MKVLNWIKKNKDGISILLVFIIIIILGLTGVLDWILQNIIVPIFSGFSPGGGDNYTPGENFPFN